MKPIIYFGIAFVLFANSCASMANQPVSDNTTQELSKQTPKPSWTGIREKYPTFPGGDVALNDFIEANMQYPQLDTITGKRRTVVVQFTVTITGELADIKIERPLSPEFDAEALRIVKSMPNWIPGEQNEKPIPMKFNLFIRFKKQAEKRRRDLNNAPTTISTEDVKKGTIVTGLTTD